MKNVKIMHCADIHLGSEIQSLGHLGVKRRAEIKQTFFEILHKCEEEQVQYLFIAGDLYEQAQPEPELVYEVSAELGKLTRTKVLIAPGNHDYITEHSHYRQEGVYPEHVFIFQGEWEVKEFPEDHLRVYGAGFTSMYRDTPFLRDSVERDESWIRIGVLHGDLVNQKGESRYNPITKQQIKNSGLHYLALGHIHQKTLITTEGSTSYAYCGCHEGRGFDELGEKGVYMGTVGQDGCNLVFVPICSRKYEQIEVDVTGVTGDAQAAEVVMNTIRQSVTNVSEEQLYKVILKGILEDGVLLHPEEIRVRMKEFYYVKFQDRTTLQVDYSLAAKEKTLKGIFVRNMLDKINELELKGKKKEADSCRLGLDIGWKAFGSEVKYREDT